MQVLILGYGEMGHAMETLLGPRHELAIWEKYPRNGFVSARLEDAAPTADFVVFCLPAGPHRDTLTRIEPLLKHDCVCISVAKGLDDSGETALEVFEQVLRNQCGFALLYGPMIAEDMRAGRYGFGQAGCSAAVFQRVRELFSGSRLCLTHSEDPCGMSWSVVLKNVYAIAFGVADGLELGDNVRGFLMVQAMRELGRIVTAMGGAPGTCYELAGLGDLVTTATSENSHHHALGSRLARGETDAVNGEGVHTLRMVASRSLLNMDHYPLLALVHAAIEDPQNLSKRFERYIAGCFTGPDSGGCTTRSPTV